MEKTVQKLTYWYNFSLDDYFQEKKAESISVSIERPRVPVIFLDTFCMFEMIKEQNGTSTDSHCKQYGRLRELITELIAKGKILSPLCIQETEIGSPKKQSEIVDSLMDYTNIDFLSPSIVQYNVEYFAFLSFIKDAKRFSIPCSVVINTKSMEGSKPNYRVHISRRKSLAEHDAEEQSKRETVQSLTELKTSLEIIDFKNQLEKELYGDFQALEIKEKEPFSFYYQWMYRQAKELLQEIHYPAKDEDTLQIYKRFLRSNHHTIMPCIWIRSVLWAMNLTRNNKIKKSDKNDIAWVSAYLPYINYCFVDKSFADLIKRTPLLKQFDAKVFSVKTFDLFLKELENLL